LLCGDHHVVLRSTEKLCLPSKDVSVKRLRRALFLTYLEDSYSRKAISETRKRGMAFPSGMSVNTSYFHCPFMCRVCLSGRSADKTKRLLLANFISPIAL
jgi:hypothetical protein